MVDKLLDIAADEFERVVKQIVEREFEALRTLPDETAELPWIGGKYFHDQHDNQQQRVVRALCARRWFEAEAPPWAQPLPLSEKDCFALINEGGHGGGHRPRLRGEYGLRLRSGGWNLKYATPFEMFCAQKLMPLPPNDPVPRRRAF